MLEAGLLNMGSELNRNNSTSDPDLTPISSFRKELEVIVIRTIQNVIGPVLEPLIQRVVKEQIDLAQERIVASMNQISGERPNSSSPRRLKLRFGNKLSDPVLTGKPISGEDGTALKIELVDENTDLIVKTGPHSSRTVEITVLRVDTKSDEKEGNASLLNGCTYLDLNEGIGSVGKISFPHRSNWTKKCKYRLIARCVDDLDGTSVIEAKSEVFTLEDSRNKRDEKHKFPTLSDEVLRLVNIGKRGPYVKLLKDENIITVKNFLTEHFKNHLRLKEILKMPEKKLNETIAHALTCEELEDKYIYYIPGSQQQMGIVLNVVGRLFGLKSSCSFSPIETLSETQKGDAQKLVVSALEHWGDVVPYDYEHSLFSGHSGLVSRDHTPLITGYDYMQPCNPPTTPSANGGSDLTQTNASLFSPDRSSDASHDNCENRDAQPNAAPEDTTPFDDTFSYPFGGTSDGVYLGLPNLFDMEFGTLNNTFSCTFGGTSDGVNWGPSNMLVGLSDDFLLRSTMSQDYIPDHWIQDAGFSIDEYFGPDERLKKDISKARFREWGKLIFVLKFSHKMKMEKLGHVKKRPKFN